MAREDPGAPPPRLDSTLANESPRFEEKLLFVFEVVPVVPLLVSPAPMPPMAPIVTPEEILGLITDSPQVPLPGAVKPGTPVLPFFLGQLPPIKLEGHNITHLSFDMATHGFTGELRFRVSDTRLLGDIKDKDRIAKVFSSENLLMLKMCLRPKVSDEGFPKPLTREPVPHVVGAVPKPIQVPPPFTPPIPELVPPQPPTPPIPPPPFPPPPFPPPPFPPPPFPPTPQPPPIPPVPQIPPIPPVPQFPPQPPTPPIPQPPQPPQPQMPIRPPKPPGDDSNPFDFTSVDKIRKFLQSPECQQLLTLLAEVGAVALLAAFPEAAPLLVILGVAAEAGLLPPELVGPAKGASGVVLAANPELAAGMAVFGMAANAGLLPPELAPIGAASGRLACEQNPEVGHIAGMSNVAAKSGLLPPEASNTILNTTGGNSGPGGGAGRRMPAGRGRKGPPPRSGQKPPANQPEQQNPADSGGQPFDVMAIFAELASISGLLPLGIADDPNMALSQPPLGDLLPLLNSAPDVAKQFTASQPKPPIPPPQQPPPAPPIPPPPQPPILPPPPAPPVPDPPKIEDPYKLPEEQLPLPKLPKPPPPLTVLPPNLTPIIAEIPEIVGTPILYENGMPPSPPLVPIEMTFTAVITEQTVIEHTSFEASDIIVSIREYTIRFADPAQAMWRRHHPLALYTATSLKQVIEKTAIP